MSIHQEGKWQSKEIEKHIVGGVKWFTQLKQKKRKFGIQDGQYMMHI